MKKNKDCTKYLLIREATKQFSLKGFSKSPIRSICSKVNVSIASINYHFGNKDKLIQEVVENVIVVFFQTLECSEKEYPTDFINFLKTYAHKINSLESEVLLIFREIFREKSNSLYMYEQFITFKKQLLLVSARIYKKDSHLKSITKFEHRIDLFNSSVTIEAIRNALLLTPKEKANYNSLINQNIEILFDQ